MLRRKLVAINTVIILFMAAVMLLAAVRSLQRLFYEESTLVYQASVDDRFNLMDDLLTQGKETALNLCVNGQVQTFLQNVHGEDSLDAGQSAQFEQLLTSLNREVGLFQFHILPVSAQGEILRRREGETVYRPDGTRAEDLGLGRGYRWEFRPEDQETIRVTRNIFSDQDPDQVIGVVQVDIGLTAFSDFFWTFATKYNMTANLYLLDEEKNVLLPYYTGGVDLEELHAAMDTPVSYELRGERVSVSRVFQQNGWILVSYLEGSALLSGSTDIILQIILLSVLVVAVGIVLTSVATRRLTAPLIRLADWMQNTHVTENYEEIPVTTETGEVRTLYDSFNRLMGMIRQSVEEIRLAGERERKNEFRMLSSQINPHFLYNTLGSISWMAEKFGATEIQEMTVNLVGMLRNGLNHGNTAILLRNELEQVRCYLKIMKIRYPENYVFHFEVEEEVEDYWVIKQILQPLAENALQHGILEDDGGELTIAAYQEEGELVLEVRNTGQRADLEKIEKLLEGDETLRARHYGIRNVDQRLRSYYGERSRLKYTLENGETVARIRLPMERVMEEPKGDN